MNTQITHLNRPTLRSTVSRRFDRHDGTVDCSPVNVDGREIHQFTEIEMQLFIEFQLVSKKIKSFDLRFPTVP